MLSKHIRAGDRIELQAVDPEEEEQSGKKGKVYSSRVCSVLSEDTLEIGMPVENGQLIPLPVDREYDMVFYGNMTSFQCFARITDRYKSNNQYILVMELTSNLRRYQRRGYYRFSCVLEMCVRPLDKDEVEAVENNLPYALTRGRPMKQSVIVDISGDELCFLSSQCYECDSLLLISYHLPKDQESKKYEMIGKVINAWELENNRGTYEHRVRFYDMDADVKEDIVRYIFEEERKSRKKRGLGYEEKNSGS